MASGLKLITPNKNNPQQHSTTTTSKSVNDYFEKLLHNPETKDNGLQYELIRISTFAQLPRHYDVSAFKLARAGFYYSGYEDEVRCYSCGLMVRDWAGEGEWAEPMEVHRKYRPECEFLNGGAGNAELCVKNTDNTTPLERPFITQSQQQEFSKLQHSTEINKPNTNSTPTNSNTHNSLRQPLFNKPIESVNRIQSNFTRSLDFTSDQSLIAEPIFKHTPESGHRSIFQESDFFNNTNSQSQNSNTLQSVFSQPIPQVEQSDAGFDDVGRMPFNEEPVVGDKGMVVNRPDNRTYARQTVDPNSNSTVLNSPPKDQPQSRINPNTNNTTTTTPHQGTSPIPYDPNDFRYERSRLESYTGFQSNSGVSISDMAKTGLFYLGDRDRVQCVFCRGILRNWEMGDVPHEEHTKHFSQCPFILDPTAVGNVPIDPVSVQGLQRNQSSSNIVTDTPVHQKYSLLSTRVQSFKYFPERSQKPEDLAKAGFFHTGTSDNVKCFFCDGGLRNWEPNDDPFTEHARWFPRCGYLLMSKGHDYIQKVQDKYNPKPTRPPPRLRNDNLKKFAVHMSKVNEYMRDHLTKLVLDMGVSRDNVKKVIIRRMEEFGSDEYFPNAESLYDAVIEYEEEEKYRQEHPELAIPHVTADDNEQSPDIEDEKKKKKKKKTKKNKKPEKSDTAEKSDVQEEEQLQYQYMDNEQVSQLAEDVNRMKEERTCKICMDEEVNIVFLKCGHLVCCSSCAPNLRHCPICRQPIKGTVRVFLS